MNTFSIWHWAIALLIGAALVYMVISTRKRTANIRTSEQSPELSGFGGWLILPMIGQTLAPFYSIGTLVNNAKMYDQFLAVPNGLTAFYGENALTVGLLALQLVTVVAMYTKHSLFPKLFLYQWLGTMAFAVADTVLVSAALNVSAAELVNPKGVAPFIATGIWVIYMLKSVRVKNTFVRGATAAEFA